MQPSEIEVISPSRVVSMGDDWFEFATPEHFWMAWRFGVLLQNRGLLPVHDQRVLEVGCGNGVFRFQLEQSVFQAVDGCDLNRSALNLAPQGRGRLMVYDVCEERAEFRAQYAALFLMDVIEHLEDDRAFLRACMAHVQPGGIVVINVPSNPQLHSKYDDIAGHFRRYTPETLEALISEAGLDLIRVVHWGALIVPFLMLRRIVAQGWSDDQVLKRGFAPPGKLAHAMLHLLRRVELALPIRIPFGTSMMAFAKLR